MEQEQLLACWKTWSGFDWDSKAAQWTAITGQTKEAREQSLAARKHLAETTKQFKRSVKTVETAGSSLDSSNTPETATAAVKAIDSLAKNCRTTIKAYQEEIDNLTRRCKSVEGAFGTMTQALGEVPDPAALLETAMEQLRKQQSQIADLNEAVDVLNKDKQILSKKSAASGSKNDKEELIQLRKEVAEYEVEFRSLKNQDITIRKLEARISELQEGGEEEFNSKLEKAKDELAETEGRRTAEALEREAAAERKVQTLEMQLKAELAGRAATQAHLLEASEGAGEREAVWEAQRRIIIDDSERLRLNLHEATRERDELRLRVAALSGGSTTAAVAPASGGMAMADLLSERAAYEAEVQELSHTVNSLREEVSVKDEVIADDRRSMQNKLDSSQTEIAALKSKLAKSEEQIASAPPQTLVDSMKRELRILKRLEYNAEDPELAERDPEMTGPHGEGEKDLESVLVAKLRRVEADLVKERNRTTDIEKECEKIRESLETNEKEKAEAEAVIASLERDLDKAITTTTPKKIKPTKDTPVLASSDPSVLQNVLDPDAAPLPPTEEVNPPTKPASAAEKAADDHSVATIIMAQRDRLRARCDALEAERDSFKRELQAQVDAAESLKTDNTKLFEKMRYLQSYNGNSGKGNRATNYARSDSRDLDLEALEQRYEASVDPFRQFGRAERQRKLKEMSPMERTVFVIAKTVLGTKEMRTFLFIYVFAMHVLVFMTTYHWSHSDSACSFDNEHLTHLPPVVAKTSEQIMEDLSGKS